MRLLRILLVRAAEADMRPDGDQARSVVGSGGFDRRGDGLDIVAVRDTLGVPAVGIEAGRHVLRPGHPGGPVQLDQVVVVEHHEPAQTQVAGQAGRLGRDALLEIAVGRDDVGPVIDDRPVGSVLVELGGQAPLSDGHADRVRESLAERSGGGLHAGRQAVLRMTGRDAAPLPEALQVLHRDVVPGQVQQ